MEIRYSGKARKQLKRICRGDRKSATLITNIIERYTENPQGMFDIKILKGKQGNFKRLRTGDYRIIFEENANTMSIYEIKHRQGAYND